jgi:biopolymer transport protein ExbB
VSSAVPGLERHLQTLAVLGAVAPLLGLLGTVTGMIHTFQLVTVFGSGDAKLLSGGISEALVTTEVGLIIAVPVLLFHAFLARRVRIVVGALERTAAEFVHRLKAHAAELAGGAQGEGTD